MDFNSTDINSIWEEVKEQIRQQDNANEQRVDAFLPLLQPQAIQEGFILLTANNKFIKNWVEQNISLLIKNALKNLYGIDFIIQIEVFEENNNQNNNLIPNIPQFNNEETNKAYVAANIVNEAKEREQSPFDIITGNFDNKSNNLSTLLTFENFVIGNSNNIAYQMSRAVAERPGERQNLNPLFIYGRSGVGKTHLLRAIENYININMPNYKVIYIDAIEFLNDYVDASSAHTANKESFSIFRNKYENTNVLLIDDIQQIQGKSGTLDIFFNIFNNLINAGKQIVISADRAPRNIQVDERYQSRFNNGMLCQITTPEIETKLGIIKSFFEDLAKDMPDYKDYLGDGIFEYIAENSSSNIRELKSAITKVFYEIELNKTHFNSENIKDLLGDHFSESHKKVINLSLIQSVVENYYQVSHKDLIGKTKDRAVSYARQMAMYLCTNLLDITTTSIGKAFNKDHSTVIYSIRIIQDKKKHSVEVSEEIETLIKTINDKH